MNNIHISIITLNKNDHLKFLKTLRSIAIQKISFCVEWLILDGSDQNIYKKNKAIIRKELLLKKDFQINLAHSFYQIDILKSKNLKGFLLSDFIEDDFFQAAEKISLENKDNIICYNPNKSSAFMKKIIAKVT